MSGSLIHRRDNSVEAFESRLSLDSFQAVATFTNPYARSVGSWDYGFSVRRSEDDTFHAIVITSDGRWTHVFEERSGRLVIQDRGSASSVRRSERASNELRLVVDGRMGWFFVNDDFITRLDLSDGPLSGDVAVITGLYDSFEVRGRSTAFRGFTVRESRLVADENGGLFHDADGHIEDFFVNTNTSDFIAGVTFTNPYSRSVGSWDYGIGFRDPGGTAFHAVTVSSNGEWEYFVRRTSTRPTYQQSGRVSLRLAARGQNDLWLMAVGDVGLFYVNGDFVAELDLSHSPSGGDIWVGTGFYGGNEVRGNATEYDDFTVYTLD